MLPIIVLPESDITATICMVIFAIFALAMFIPNLAVNIRRLHDTGRSGWWYLITFIPVISLVYIVFMIRNSEPGTNKYGENPKGVQKEA